MNTRKPPAEVLTLAEAAAYLRVSPRQAQRLAKAGELAHFRLTPTGHTYCRLDDLRAFVAKRTAETMAKLPVDPLADESTIRRIA